MSGNARYGYLAGTATRSDYGGTYTGAILDLVAGTSVQDIQVSALELFTLIMTSGAVISIADIGADFFDYAIGLLVAGMTQPLADAIITKPLQLFLTKGFRYDPPGWRMVQTMISDGLMDKDTLTEVLQESGIADKYFPPMLSYAGIRQQQAANKILDQGIDAGQELQTYLQKLYVTELDTQVRALDAAVLQYEIDVVRLPLENTISIIDAIASKLDSYANQADFGYSTTTQANALARLPSLISYGLQVLNGEVTP